MGDMPCFVGIDVAKAQLDIAVRPSGERWTVPNDAGGVGTLVEQLQALHPTLHCTGSHGGPGACCYSRVGHGWPPCRSCEPTAGT